MYTQVIAGRGASDGGTGSIWRGAFSDSLDTQPERASQKGLHGSAAEEGAIERTTSRPSRPDSRPGRWEPPRTSKIVASLQRSRLFRAYAEAFQGMTGLRVALIAS